jgi:glycosyltransferase involved in cell wall biosynthesis
VQQNWFRKVCSQKLGVPENRFIVARPNIKKVELDVNSFAKKPCRTFFYPSFPRPFKNFETVCRAADILNKKGITDFKVVLTIDGSENNYSKWIKSLCNDIPNIVFTGLLTKDEMYRQYDETDCLIFPSRLETWGLPISEFIPFNRPMIIADELYSHETSAGASAVAFYKTNDEHALAKLMEDAINCRWKKFVSLESETVNHPYADSYEALFDLLLGPSN